VGRNFEDRNSIRENIQKQLNGIERKYMKNKKEQEREEE
jgi:hypothetical protein